jgi:hypothetical protein
MATAKKRKSGRPISWLLESSASSIGVPISIWSEMARNTVLTGGWASLLMERTAVVIGRPARSMR